MIPLALDQQKTSTATPARKHFTLALCAAAAMLEGFDTQSMGVAAPRLVAEFGLSASQSGWIFSATTLGLFIGAAIGGRVADHVGRKRTLMGSLALLGLFSILTSLSRSPQALLAARVLTGLGLGGALPNFISLSSESVEAHRRLGAVTVVMAGMPFGGACAGMVALGAALGWDWRAIFYVGGACPLLVALIMAFYLPESRGFVRTPGLHADPPIQGVTAALFGESRARTTVLLWVGYFFTQLVLLLMLNWLPSLMIGLGFSRLQASWISVAFNLSGAAFAIGLGHLCARGKRRRWIALTYGGMACALAAVAFMRMSFTVALLACAAAGAFIIAAQLLLFALAPLFYPARIRGTGVGAAVAMGRLGSVVGPLFAGTLLAAGGGSAAVLLAILPFVLVGGSAAVALTWRPESRE
jgi:AAHS family 3-hydroxyphenylpropionic acid transporter